MDAKYKVRESHMMRTNGCSCCLNCCPSMPSKVWGWIFIVLALGFLLALFFTELMHNWVGTEPGYFLLIFTAMIDSLLAAKMCCHGPKRWCVQICAPEAVTRTCLLFTSMSVALLCALCLCLSPALTWLKAAPPIPLIFCLVFCVLQLLAAYMFFRHDDVDEHGDQISILEHQMQDVDNLKTDMAQMKSQNEDLEYQNVELKQDIA